MAQTATIRWGAWYGDVDLPLDFPDNWHVGTFPMRGGADIGDAGIRQAFENPIGSSRLSGLAGGRRSACVVVDDLSRPTPADRLIPFVLEELRDVDSIRFVMGIAAHRPMTREDCVKKLGREVVERFAITNHHPYENLVDLGKTRFGTPVLVNRYFAEADLKICIGSINPHAAPGFGGGAKLVLPGVAGIESLYHMHRPDIPPRGKLCVVDGNEVRDDMEEFARIAGLNAIVNVVVNEQRGIAACFVGDFIEAHRAGVRIAREVFATEAPSGWDVGIFNTYPKDVEWVQAGMAFNVWHTAKVPLVHESGSIVLCCAATEGAGHHSLFGPEMRLGSAKGSKRQPFGDRQLLIFSPNLNEHDLEAGTRKDAILCRSWESVVHELLKRHGAGTRAAIFPCSAIQIAD